MLIFGANIFTYTPLQNQRPTTIPLTQRPVGSLPRTSANSSQPEASTSASAAAKGKGKGKNKFPCSFSSDKSPLEIPAQELFDNDDDVHDHRRPLQSPSIHDTPFLHGSTHTGHGSAEEESDEDTGAITTVIQTSAPAASRCA